MSSNLTSKAQFETVKNEYGDTVEQVRVEIYDDGRWLTTIQEELNKFAYTDRTPFTLKKIGEIVLQEFIDGIPPVDEYDDDDILIS